MVKAKIVRKTIEPVRMPWSSGRLLTGAERDRKRRVNRESQLLRRERMKEQLRAFDSRLGKVEEHYDQLCRSQPTVRFFGSTFVSPELRNAGANGSPSLSGAAPFTTILSKLL